MFVGLSVHGSFSRLTPQKRLKPVEHVHLRGQHVPGPGGQCAGSALLGWQYPIRGMLGASKTCIFFYNVFTSESREI